MTYRNDPYDPKQVALLDPAALDDAVADAEKAFADAGRPRRADRAASPAHLGDRSPVSLARREIGALPPAAKSDAGKRVNEARRRDPGRLRRPAGRAGARSGPQRVLVEERVDVTLPWDRRPRGARHPLTTLMERIGDLFVGMGYEVAEGPEVELEWANFDALNIAAGPPGARADGHLLRRPAAGGLGPGAAHAHLAGAGAHDADPQAADLRRRARAGSTAPTSWTPRTRPVFHQVEGLVVDKGITMAHLRGTLDHFARAMFGAGGADPLAAALLPVHRAVGRVRRLVPGAPRRPAWVEWGGCGMVNPRVLRACGIDPEVYSGFAFGMGIERTLMFRHGVSDMRDMVEGDVRFTRAFGMEVH